MDWTNKLYFGDNLAVSGSFGHAGRTNANIVEK